MNSARLFRIISAAAIALSAYCTNDPVTGGGTDLPNGMAKVVGVVSLPDSTPAESCSVWLREVVVTSWGDSVVSEQPSVTDSTGVFQFDSVATGKYTLFAEFDKEGASSLEQFISVPESGTVSLPAMTLHPYAEMIGHILLPPGADYSGMRVFVPGVQYSIPVDSQGGYVLPQSPRGSFDLAFVYNRTANFIHITTGADSLPTIFLRDVEFALIDIMADAPCRSHQTTFSNSYYISPKAYSSVQTPDWYGSVDLNCVRYSRLNSNGTFEGWKGDTTHPYDFIACGPAKRVSTGEVVLTTPSGEKMVLTGEKVEWIDTNPHNVVVAVVIHVNAFTSNTEYFVIDIKEFPS
jgi:hypothetical protein